MEHALDVGLRGTRNYVQGSQILARTAEIVAPTATLLTAKFTRITEQGVIAAIDGDAADGEEIGSAQFDVDGKRVAVRYIDVPGPKAPRIDDVPGSTSGLETDGAGTGHADFAIDGTFESYLAAVIECVKAIHARRGDQVTDIWFTALVGARLPVVATYPTTGALRVTPKIERIVAGRLQTLSLVDTDGTAAPPQFQICFSCLMGG